MPSATTGASGLAGRYATALFELAESRKMLDEVADDLARLRAMVHESADLRRLISSPVISREDQAGVMTALADAAGMSGLTRNFFGLVAMNRRLFALGPMIDAYLALLAQSRGEVTAQITSAGKLTQKHMDAIADALKMAVGSEITLDARVDPSLLGGLVVKVGSKMIDSSLRTKLQKLELAMKGIG